MLRKITLFTLYLLLTGNSIIGTESCQKFFVTATDGYVNIRSYPQIYFARLQLAFFTQGQ
ncbi:hypothetical protein [Microcystis aeruginosa]|uniref:hypothetical protein n=1 Tax=Microcystis aeruginosa TaxID=1126 RepID=UPI0009001BB9|nr:hypothetical protein [Microcystis aeruginosa]